MARELKRENYGLPPRMFLYTLDQVAMIVAMPEQVFRATYVHYFGRNPGARPFRKMEARNIAPEGEKPEWRISEGELVRWMKYMGYKVYTRGWSR